MSTPHNEANKGDFAKTVLRPGDPLRAKFIAETFLTDVKQVNTVRNRFGYTGYYKGKKVSVRGSGRGMPSIGIYSYELFHDYGVERIIRIGTAGATVKDLNLFDIVVAQGASTNSAWQHQYGLTGTYSAISSYPVLEEAVKLDDDAKALLIRYADKMKMSARAYHRTLKLARTIADLQNEKNVSKVHIAEALSYRYVMPSKQV